MELLSKVLKEIIKENLEKYKNDIKFKGRLKYTACPFNFEKPSVYAGFENYGIKIRQNRNFLPRKEELL